MIEFQRKTLSNGLRLIIHPDTSTQFAVVNVLYDVGARDEEFNKTGFAHLFEHLMFGGSINIPDYDEPLQMVGGENNAYTTPDLTNYYCSLPAANLETAFWLESDRMLSLDFSDQSLEVQRKVVIEEFKQRYLNQPYGDTWLKIRPLAYKVHPYRWPTIGREISHIENATLKDVKDFFYKFYVPKNAVLVVTGNVEPEEVTHLAEKWFGPIPGGEKHQRQLPVEPPQNERRFLEVKGDVPLDALYMSFHTEGRSGENFHSFDLLSDVLGRGKSSRLYKKLIKEKQIFNQISAYTSGSFDPGMLVIEGKLNPGKECKEAETEIYKIIQKLQDELIEEGELEKVKNKAESSIQFENMSCMHKAAELASAECMGDANLVNFEVEGLRKVTVGDINQVVQKSLNPENASVMYYKKR